MIGSGTALAVPILSTRANVIPYVKVVTDQTLTTVLSVYSTPSWIIMVSVSVSITGLDGTAVPMYTQDGVTLSVTENV